jgi:uncharacterized membrane protein
MLVVVAAVIGSLIPAVGTSTDPGFIIMAGLGLYYLARISENLEKEQSGEKQ